MRFDLANASGSVIVSSMANVILRPEWGLSASRCTQERSFLQRREPQEYPFESNVNPKVPHPRWSQAFERMIDTGDRIRTQLYNGYGNLVAKLYEK